MKSPSQPDHILIADDYRAHRNALAFGLSKAGFRVAAAADATRALRLAEAEDFDLIITDYYMPDLTGSDLIKKLRQSEAYANTPMILLTARANELNLNHLRDDLSVLVVAKPCPMKRLIEMVSECLAIARSTCGSDAR